FAWLDAFALMRPRELLLLLLLGGIGALAAYPVSGRMLDTLPIGFSNYSRFIAPWIEEAIKGVIVIMLFRFNRIGYKLDAVLTGFAIGAGFSVVENIFYLTFFPQYGTGTWLVRGFGTALMHGTTTALFAAIAHEFAERESRESAGGFNFRLWWFVPGYLVAVTLHMAFNQFPEHPLTAMMGALVVTPIAIMAIFHFGQAEASRWLEQDRAEHSTLLAMLDSGAWPDSTCGRRIAALAKRLGPEAEGRIRAYCRALAWLVVEAEETMIEESAGDVAMNRGKVAAAFADLDRLRTAMGRSTFAALKPLLPFSRNDYWEVAELRQRAG
ncbi:MAG: PrsW family glutamic-type intramembrane protease, partial [Sphingomicrobium sp.]